MSADRPFFDTNVLLYLLSTDSAKADKAEALLQTGGIVSVQVLNEFASVALRKAKLGWHDLREVLAAVRAACHVIPLTMKLHDEGIAIAERYKFSIYDSMIIAAAMTAGCGILHSEGLQDQQRIGRVTICNPF